MEDLLVMSRIARLTLGFVSPEVRPHRQKTLSIWANHTDLTVLPSPGIMVNKRNHLKMVPSFRLVHYSNLPRYIVITVKITIFNR